VFPWQLLPVDYRSFAEEVKREERIEMIIKFSYDINWAVPEVIRKPGSFSEVFRQKKIQERTYPVYQGQGGCHEISI
jgi:hypothetical protein